MTLPGADRRCTLPGTIVLCDPGIMGGAGRYREMEALKGAE